MNHLADNPAPSMAAPRGPLGVEWAPIGSMLLLVAVFVGAPLAAWWMVPPIGRIPFLWLVAAGVWYADRAREEKAQARVTATDVRAVFGRFGFSAILLVAIVAIAVPERLFDWPRERPWWWLSVLLSYPLLSVLPQEVIYRSFLFRRLRMLFGRDRWSVAASAVVFGGMHVIYANTPAIALTLIGGWFFADTYRRTRSLRLVCLEHSLYGALIFSVGLGDFFSRLPPGP